MAGHLWKPEPEKRRWTCDRCGTTVAGCSDAEQKEPWPSWAGPEDDCDQALVHAVHDL